MEKLTAGHERMSPANLKRWEEMRDVYARWSQLLDYGPDGVATVRDEIRGRLALFEEELALQARLARGETTSTNGGTS